MHRPRVTGKPAWLNAHRVISCGWRDTTGVSLPAKAQHQLQATVEKLCFIGRKTIHLDGADQCQIEVVRQAIAEGGFTLQQKA